MMASEADDRNTLAGWYTCLVHEDPILAGKLAAESEMVAFAYEGDVQHAPKLYVELLLPKYQLTYQIEHEYTCYDAAPKEVQLAYIDAWTSMRALVPPHIRQHIDDGRYLEQDWH